MVLGEAFVRRLGLVGVLGVLAIVSGCQLKNESGHSQVLATVNGEEITNTEVAQYVHEHPEQTSQDVENRVAIDAVIDQRLGQDAARQAGVDRQPSVMLDLLDARKMALLEAYGRELAAAAQPPSLANMQTWYQDHPLWYAQRCAYHVSRWIMQGDPLHQRLWLQGLSQYSVLDDAAANWLVSQKAPFSRIAEILEPDRLSADQLARLSVARPWSGFVVSQNDRFVEILVLESVDPQPLAWPSAAALVAQDMAHAAGQRALQAREAILRRSAKIVYQER